MKIPILAPATNSGTLKEEFLQCFGLRVSNETKLREVVRDLAGAGVSKKRSRFGRSRLDMQRLPFPVC